MSRIRTIKPALWKSQSLSRVSREARLVFIGLISEADDAGRLIDSPKQLAGALFPFDEDVDHVQVGRWLQELVTVGSIVRYVVDGARYIAIPTFQQNQVVNRPTPSSIPPPTTHGVLTESSLSPHGGLTAGMEGKGMEEEGKGREAPAAPVAVSPPPGVDRSRQNPDAPAPLPGKVLSDAELADIRRRNSPMGKGAFMEDRTAWCADVDALLTRHGEELRKAHPALDGKAPRPALRTCVVAHWGWYERQRAQHGHEAALARLHLDLAKDAATHRIGWEREHATTVDNSAAVQATRMHVLRPLEGPHPAESVPPEEVRALLAGIGSKRPRKAPS